MNAEQYCLTVKDVYGAPAAQLKIPDGWALSGEFRPPQNGERILTVDGRAAEAYNGPNYPRLILKKATTVEDVYGVPLSALTPPEGWEFTGEFRPGKKGETVLGGGAGQVGRGAVQMGTIYEGTLVEARLILRKLPTIKDIYGKELADLKAPDGWRFTGEFRILGYDEHYLTPTEDLALSVCPPDKPRLILEKIPATPTIREVYGTDAPAIPAGWKIKEFRQVAHMEPVTVLGARYTTHEGTAQWVPKHEHFFSYSRFRLVLEQDLSQFKWTTGPEFIYGTKLPEVPAGYKVVAFRPPLAGEKHMSDMFGGPVRCYDFDLHHPRLILERL